MRGARELMKAKSRSFPRRIYMPVSILSVGVRASRPLCCLFEITDASRDFREIIIEPRHSKIEEAEQRN